MGLLLAQGLLLLLLLLLEVIVLLVNEVFNKIVHDKKEKNIYYRQI